MDHLEVLMDREGDELEVASAEGLEADVERKRLRTRTTRTAPSWA